MHPVILIPARMASTRLPGKPLAEIGGKPMIVHVADRAREADCADIVVAADDTEIVEAVKAHGHQAVITSREHQSGSDRIFEALGTIDPDGRFDIVINVQGDLPALPPHEILASLAPLTQADCDIATLAAIITDPAERTDEHVVKVIGSPIGSDTLRALYFTRATAPWGEGPLFHHIGLYAYRRHALERFVTLPPSVLEQRERLEQLRALEAGMSIHVRLVDSVPLGVDTPADLEKARALLA